MNTLDAHAGVSAFSEEDAETRLLLSADASGRIPFPERNNREVAIFLHALSQLDERGHVQHRLQNGDFACYLTDSGKRLKAQAARLS